MKREQAELANCSCMFDVPSLKIRSRSGVYAPGQERVVQILETAFNLLVEEGYDAVKLREIARRCSIRVSAIHHYYKSRDDLIQDLLIGILNSYELILEDLKNADARTAETNLVKFITSILDDIQTLRTTRLFPELWSVANRDPNVARLIDIIYVRSRGIVADLIALINPKLDQEARETLALYVQASLEGMTIFAGHDKPWAGQMPLLKDIACKSLIQTVRTFKRNGKPTPGWHPPTLLSAEDYAKVRATGTAPSIKSTASKKSKK